MQTLGVDGAIGIGSVNVVVSRAHRAPDMCSITLYDVPHIPFITCNGISISRERRAGAGIFRGGDRMVAMHRSQTVCLFETKSIWVKGGLHRVCLFGEMEETVKVELPQEMPWPVSLPGNDWGGGEAGGGS